jgi:hypothetical protein
VLAQESRRGLLPHDYLALVGDSYAQGAGHEARGRAIATALAGYRDSDRC